jgi:transposase
VVGRTTVSRVASLEPLLGPEQPSAIVAIEACREAWYVHDLLRSWGNEVVVVDTTRSKQIGVGQHRKKTDRVDAESLARALERGGIPKAHVLSPARRELRRYLGVRRALVEARANLVSTIRGLARERAVFLPSCDTDNFARTMSRTQLEPELRQLVQPLIDMVSSCDEKLVDVEGKLARLCSEEPLVVQLMTAPAVGALVAAAFISVIDDARRFTSAHQVEAYLGLVPSEATTGGKRRLGAITKQGNSYLRALLVQASWSILRLKNKNEPLKLWAAELVKRRGKRIAVVALARRLAGVMWAIWRRNTVYDPGYLAERSERGLRRTSQDADKRADALLKASKKQSRLRLALRPTAAPSN